MKKWFCFAAALLLAVDGFALRPGDKAQALKNVKWILGTPFSILPPEDTSPDDPQYKAVVFLLTRARTADETLTLLNYLRRTFAGKVRFAAVTPDSKTDAEALLNRRPDFTLSFGLDTQRKLTPLYLGSNRILPLAFLVDKKGKIIWTGEVIDLGETLHRCLNNTFDRSVQPEIAPLLEKLQTLLSGNNESQTRQTVDDILQLEPGQPSALRIGCFVLESHNRAADALNLIRSQIVRAPQLARLYIEALNLIARNPELDNETDAIIQSYRKAVVNDPDADNQIAWLLLNRRPNDPNALKDADALMIRAVSNLKPDASGALRGTCLNTRALLAYRLGKVAAAARLQEQAANAFHSAALPAAETEARQRLNYYRTVLELAAKQ